MTTDEEMGFTATLSLPSEPYVHHWFSFWNCNTNTHNYLFVHSYILFSRLLLIFVSLSAPFFHDHPHPNTHTHMHTRPQHDSVWLGPLRWSLTTLQQTAVVRVPASPYQGVWKLPELSGGDPVPDLSEWLPAGRKPGVLIGGESDGKRRTDT